VEPQELPQTHCAGDNGSHGQDAEQGAPLHPVPGGCRWRAWPGCGRREAPHQQGRRRTLQHDTLREAHAHSGVGVHAAAARCEHFAVRACHERFSKLALLLRAHPVPLQVCACAFEERVRDVCVGCGWQQHLRAQRSVGQHTRVRRGRMHGSCDASVSARCNRTRDAGCGRNNSSSAEPALQRHA
jgi:hypothetical protein